MNDSLPRDAVDQAVADHYAAQSLDADALAALRAQIDAATLSAEATPDDALASSPDAALPPATPDLSVPGRLAPDRDLARPTVSARTRWMAGAVGLAVLAVAFLAWPQPALSGDQLAREIASSHVMSLKPDIDADSFDEARARLDKLDFAAVRPSEDVMPDFLLTGARYTRLGGEMGAEFQIMDAAGRPCTLFQVRDEAAFREVPDEVVYEIDGVRVKVWREAGLLMGLAEPAEPVQS